MSLTRRNLKNCDEYDENVISDEIVENRDESDETRSEYYDHEAICFRGRNCSNKNHSVVVFYNNYK